MPKHGLEQRNAELALLNSVSEVMVKSLDVKTMTRLVGDKIREVFASDTALIMLLDRQTNLITVPYEYDRNEGGYIDYVEPFPLGTGLASKVITTGQPLMLGTLEEEIANGAYFPPEIIAKGSGFFSQSWLGVPIITNERVLGLVALADARTNAFDENHLRLLQILSANLGIAIENAHLFDETQRLLAETRQRSAELAILNSIGEAMSRTLDIKTLIRIVGDKLHDIFKADGIVITLLDQQAGILQRMYEYDEGEGGYVDVDYIKPYRLGKGLTSKVILSKQPLMLGDYEEQQANGAYFPPGSLEQTSGRVTQSWLGVPIIVNEQALGVIQLGDYRPHAFNDNHLRLLQTLSANVGIAIENARLFEAEQARGRELAMINSVQEILASHLDIDTVYELIGDNVRAVFNVQVVDMVVYDPATNLITMPYSYEKGDRSVMSPRAPYGFRQQVINSGQPFLINRDFVRVAEAYDNPLITGEWPKSALFVPLLVDGKAIGVISIQDLEREKAFTQGDVRLLQTLASTMSAALENARLFRAEQQAREQAEILRSIAQALNQSLSLKDVFNLVLTEIQKVIPYDSAAVYQVYGNRREFITGQGFTNLDDLVGISFEFNQQDDEIGYLISQSMQPIILKDAPVEYPQYFNAGSHAATKIRSYLAVPIVLDQELIGMITLDKEEPVFYDEQHARLAMIFAAQAATAINNARLFAAAQQRAAELETVTTISAALTSELDLTALIPLVGEQTRSLFHADIAYVALFDEANGMINFPYTYGEEMPPMQYGLGLTSKIIETNQLLLINQEIDRQTLKTGDTIVGQKSLSFLGVPISLGGKAVGVISVQSTRREGMFHEADARLLTTLASHVGIALRNAQLYKKARQARADTE